MMGRTRRNDTSSARISSNPDPNHVISSSSRQQSILSNGGPHGGSNGTIGSGRGSRATALVTVTTSKANHVVYPPAVRRKMISGGSTKDSSSNEPSNDPHGYHHSRGHTDRESSRDRRSATARHISRHSLQEAYNHDENEENERIAHLVHVGSPATSPVKELPSYDRHHERHVRHQENGHGQRNGTSRVEPVPETSSPRPRLQSREYNETSTTLPKSSTTSTSVTRSHPFRKSFSVSRDPDEEKRQNDGDNNNTGARTTSRTSSLDGRVCDKYGFFIENDDVDGTDKDDAEKDEAQSNGTLRRSGRNKSPTKKATAKEAKPKLSDLDRTKKREKKWTKMLRDNQEWDLWIRRRWPRVRDRCRKGIPDSVRGKAWFYLCGGHLLKGRNPRLFAQLDREKGDESIVEEIRKDLHRQFPSHEMFAVKDGAGQRDLFRILKAFAVLRPETGYCQAQAPIAAVLLMQMPAEEAFWALIAVCDHFLPNYFAPGLEAVQIHGDMLNALLKRYAPYAYKSLKRNSVEPVLYMCEWFMCIFSRSLPWASVLRIWDMFLCEGVIVVFKAAIAILSASLSSKNESRCNSLYDIVEFLKHLPPELTNEHFLMDRLLKIDLNDKRLIEEHKRQEKKRKKTKALELKKREKEKERKAATATTKK